MNTIILSLRKFSLRLAIIIFVLGIPLTICILNGVEGRALGITTIGTVISMAFFYITFAAHAIEDDKKTPVTIYLFIAAHAVSLLGALSAFDESPDFSNMIIMDLLTDDNNIETWANQTAKTTAPYIAIVNIFMLAGLFYSQKSVNKRFNVAWWLEIAICLCSVLAVLSILTADNFSIYSIFSNIGDVLGIIFLVILFIIGKPQSKNEIKTPQQAPDKSQQSRSDVSSKSEELLKLKSLLDAGVLTQEEFDSEKRKILNS